MDKQLNPIAAVEDLLWLQNRFKGLLDVIPRLQAISSLEAYETELQASVASAKANLEEMSKVLSASKEVLDRETKKANEIVIIAKSEAEDILLQAKADAEKLKEAAKAEISQEITNLAAQKQKKVKELKDLEEKSSALSAVVAEQQKTLDDLTRALNELKARF